MNIKEIKEMIALMNENGLNELEIEKEGMRIRLKKKNGPKEEMNGEPVYLMQENLRQVKPKETEPSSQQKEETGAIEIKAPMVGTFYRAPSPEAPPYVEVGQIVNPGQVICIIEAMKLMNEIKSEVKGKILEVLVENTEPVEFGQPMFLIEPK
ncbi:MAG: acetyl-CoA carboxylase, biotin carboxyl carrier protein [Candidatus Omnitrophota bacterium]|nr:MAG: acetyl-CoA carboxylase, biotin carboxyl carrier protein [Candidatus Omnitrophota bacterium]